MNINIPRRGRPRRHPSLRPPTTVA